ncbi:MAG: DUF5666 domain-containing protein [Caldimonas sp.]
MAATSSAARTACNETRAPLRKARAVIGALVLALVASCGGGVDSGGTGAPSTSFASGPITGFGSVVVNGVHFDDRSATVTDADGNPRRRDDLRLGMTTDVRGSAIFVDGNGNNASTATSIVFASDILGPLAANDTAARTMTVLGQTIDVSASTAFDASLAGGQAALSVGDIVEVYATYDAGSGRYSATRVERKTTALAFRVRGVVASFDAATKTFSIGTARISYAALGGGQLPTGLGNGRLVRVTLAPAQVAGIWQATSASDGVQAIENRETVKIRDRISSFTSAQQFSVDGTVVDARAASFPAGTAGLRLGARVEVQGATVAGILIASTVTVISDGDDANQSFELEGAVDGLDAAAQTFVIREVTVSYSGSVDFRNGSAADLALGKSLEVRGMLSADGTRLQAARITFGN